MWHMRISQRYYEDYCSLLCSGMTLCSLVDVYLCFGEMYGLHLQVRKKFYCTFLLWRLREHVILKFQETSATLYGVISQEAVMFTFPFVEKHFATIALNICNLNTRGKWLLSFTLQPLYVWLNFRRHPPVRSLVGLSDTEKSVRFKNLTRPAGHKKFMLLAEQLQRITVFLSVLLHFHAFLHSRTPCPFTFMFKFLLSFQWLILSLSFTFSSLCKLLWLSF